MIEFRNVSFGYEPEKLVLDRFSFTLNTGDRLVFTGDSGSGKTTVLRLLLGLEHPTNGVIIKPENCRFSTVFQEDRLLPSLSVEQNILIVGSFRRHSPEEADFYDFVGSLIKSAGLYEFSKKYPSELSGGQKRRVSLLRAIAYGGDVLLLDEPLKGLDFSMKQRMADLITTSFDSILLVSHDNDEVELLKCTRRMHLPSKLL